MGNGLSGSTDNAPRIRSAILTILAIVASAGQLTPAAQNTSTTQKAKVTMHASGSFIVKLDVQSDAQADPQMGRMTIEKQFHGDLEGTSKGQMLAANTDVKGSAGYVALEKVTGKLGGQAGSFILQHTGTMNRGTPQLSITVVPDSGTGELKGLIGSMQIIIAEGKHGYKFDYTMEK